MNEINFNNIQIEGFRSFVTADEFSYLRPGINLVKGKNGSGKSTLVEGIFWALYGENLKGTTKTKIPSKKEYRSKSFQGTRVMLNISVNGKDYIIARHIKYKGETLGLKGDDKLMVFEDTNGEYKLRGDELYNNDSQEFINSLIGIDSNTFLNSVVFGQKMKRLVEASPSEKRDIFEKLFNLDFIDAAKAKAKEKKQVAQDKKTDYEFKLNTAEVKLGNALDKLERDKKDLQEFEKKREEKLDTLRITKTGIEKDLKQSEANYIALRIEYDNKTEKLLKLDGNDEEVSSKRNEMDDLQSSINLDTRALSTIDNDIIGTSNNAKKGDEQLNNSKKLICKLKKDFDNVDTDCPTCGADLDPSKIKDAKIAISNKIKKEDEVIEILSKNVKDIHEVTLPALEADKNRLEKEREGKQEKLEELKTELIKIKEAGANIHALDKEVTELKYKMVNEVNQEKNISTRLEDTNTLIEEWENKQLVIDLEKTEQEVEEYKTTIDECQDKIVILSDILDKVTWWVNKGFGSSGIKSYVFFAMLNNLNKSILKYCDRLGIMVQFSVDMDKASKPFLTKCFTSEGVEMDYNELSGGEQARINIATAFAFYDLIADSKTKFNCIFLDETFAGLDEDGLYQAFDLVRSICDQGKSVYVITHKTDIDMRNTKTIDIVKENRISRVL